MDPEDGERTGNEPVVERRFFQIRHTVEARRDPIPGLKHVTGDLCLDGINVVHQRRRRNDASQVDGSGDEQNGQVDAPALACNKIFGVADDAA